jgi:molybdate transport system ATP-binding protein
MLAAALDKRMGGFSLEAAVEVPAGLTLALVGESGAGKTTLLRLLAGLAAPDAGRITVEEVTWYDGAAGISLPPWKRDVGFLFQDYALFPHLTAVENVAFGLRAAGLRRRIAADRARAMLERLAAADLADQKPDQLSGGQQQRVALARALALEPRLLLLDEPLSALDRQTRREVRTELRRCLQSLSCATVYVTHNPMEALAFGNRLAVLERGRITQQGEAASLLRHPRTPYVAEFMGMNFFRGQIAGRQGGVAIVAAGEGNLLVSDPPDGEGEVFVAVNPREITLFLERPAGSAQNVFRGEIRELVAEDPGGDRVRVALATTPPLVAEVTRQAVQSLGLRPGLEVYASFKAVGVEAYR